MLLPTHLPSLADGTLCTFTKREVGSVRLPAAGLHLHGCTAWELWLREVLIGRLYRSFPHTLIDLPEGAWRLRYWPRLFGSDYRITPHPGREAVGRLVVYSDACTSGRLRLPRTANYEYRDGQPSVRDLSQLDEPLLTATLTDGTDFLHYELGFDGHPDQYHFHGRLRAEGSPPVLAAVAGLFFLHERLWRLQSD